MNDMRRQTLRMADGGMLSGIKRTLGMAPPETVTQKFARQDAERAAKAAKNAPPPAPTPAPVPGAGISGYSGNGALEGRMKAAGLRDGGTPYHKGSMDGGRVVGPGTTISDSVPARYSRDEYVLPADTAKAIGHDNLDAIKDATHVPAAVQRGYSLRGQGGQRGQQEIRMDDGGKKDLPRNPNVGPNGSAQAQAFREAQSARMGPRTPGGWSAAPEAGAPAAKPSLLKPLTWTQGVSDAGRATGQGAAKGIGAASKVVGEAGKTVASGIIRNGNSVANTVAATMGHGNAFFDDTIPRLDRLRIGATDAAAALGGGIGGVFGASAGSVVPVAGTVAGGIAGAMGGEKAGRWLGEKVFGGSEILQRNGYDSSRDALAVGSDALKNGFSNDLFGKKTIRAGGGRGSVNPPLANAPPPTRSDDQPATTDPATTGPATTGPADRLAGDATMPGQDPGRNTLRGMAGTDVIGAPGVNKFVQNGKTLYSNVPGADNDKLMSNNPGVSTVPGMSQAQISQTLTNPDGSRWSAGDNATMAANLRDGVDAYRGTSRDERNNPDFQLGQLAASPLGTPGRAFAQKQLGLRMADSTTRRGQDMEYEGKMQNRQQAAEAAQSTSRAEQQNKDRTYELDVQKFGVEVANKSRDDKRAGEAAFDDRVSGFVGTDKDGKPDARAASAVRNASNVFLADKQAKAEAALKKDPGNKRAAAILDDILTNGVGGIDDATLRTILLGQKANTVAQEYDGWSIDPWAGKATNTQAPVTSLTLQDNAILPNQYMTDNGQLIPRRAVEDNPDLQKLIRLRQQ